MGKAWEILKLAATALLLLSLVCLSVFYMNSYRSVKTYDFTAENDKAVRSQFYKSSYVGLMRDSFVFPYFVGICVDGAKTGYIGAGAANIYGSLEGVVSDFLSRSAEIHESSAEEFSACADGDFIYIRYRCALPRSAIYYMQNSDMILEDVGDEYIFDMFVLPYERGTYAVARDKRGNYYRLMSGTASAINKNTLTSYTYFDRSFSFSFAKDITEGGAFADLGFGEKLDGFEIMTAKAIYASSAVVDMKDLTAGGEAARIASALGMNPERATSHESEDGITYYDEGENLFVGRRGEIVYSAFSAQYGIPVSDIIGYGVSSGGYTLTDLIGAALVLGDSLGVFDGGAFSYAVTETGQGNEGTTIEISHVYDGITVDFSGARALKIVIAENSVTHVSCVISKSTPYDGENTVENYAWLIRSAVAKSEGKIGFTYIQTPKNGRLYLQTATVTNTEANDE